MKKKDIVLAAALLLAALLLFLGLRLGGGEPGGEVRVTVDGLLYGTYPLSGERKIRVEQESGVNILRIQDGAVWMEEADCPDGYCVRQGRIERKNQTIVCLPHRLVVEIIGEKEEAGEPEMPDAVVN